MHDALVLKKEADRFTVKLSGSEKICCSARKNLKKEGVFVGDAVQIDEFGAICSVKKRANLLIRPPLANVKKMFLVVAKVPKPDFYLLDKLIIFCRVNKIEPIVCINKQDLDENFCRKIEQIYVKTAHVLSFSSKNESVCVIKKEISGVCALAGQSAVGKSSIINALLGEKIASVGDFSKKIERGKQTTRTVELYKFEDGYLADTAGFSKLDESLLHLEYDEIKNYYPEFMEVADGCKYKSCLHTNDKDCAVIKNVKSGKIAKIRYENYLKLLRTLKILKKF